MKYRVEIQFPGSDDWALFDYMTLSDAKLFAASCGMKCRIVSG
jgi:hypothetical protein